MRTKHELPLALGHEISGHVVETGTDALWFTDRAVIIPAVIPCGQCDACQRGKATICPNQKMPGNDIQGGFATHIVVPSRGLCVVDEHRLAGVGIDLADLSVIADAVTTPYQAVVQAGVAKGDLVVVNGVGGVGGYCAQIAAAMGGVVVAIDVNEDKLAAITGQGAVAHAQFQADVGARHQRRRSRPSPRNTGCARPNGSSSNAPAPRPGRRRPSACSITAPRSASSASPWTRSRCGCPT